MLANRLYTIYMNKITDKSMCVKVVFFLFFLTKGLLDFDVSQIYCMHMTGKSSG